MIITQIIGGLGNQMFQYAAGRALSLKNDTTLALDISGFETATEADVSSILGWQFSSGIRLCKANLHLTSRA